MGTAQLARIFAQILQNEDLWDSNNEELGYAMKLLSVPNAVREQTEVQEGLGGRLQKLRSGDVWLQPQGYKLELLESKRGDVHQNFKTRLDVLATSISIILLGHNLAQGDEGGQPRRHIPQRWTSRERPASAIPRCLVIGYRQLLRLWVRLNFAPGSTVTFRSRPKHYPPARASDRGSPGTRDKLADRGKEGAEGLNTFLDAATRRASMCSPWESTGTKQASAAIWPAAHAEGQERKVKYLSGPRRSRSRCRCSRPHADQAPQRP